MKKYLMIFCFICACSLYGQSKVGTAAAEFLTIPTGAKAVAMGGAFTALADDITAAYWNPGGLSRLKGNQFNVNYAEWFLGTKLSWAGAGVSLTENDFVAVSVTQLDYGEEPVTTIDQPEGTGENWDASDIALSLSYARNLTDRFSIGGTFKYVRQKIWHESASGIAFDVGLLFNTQFEGLSVGMAISNFGQEMKLEGKDLLRPIDIDPSYHNNNQIITTELSTDYWEMPLVFSVGLSWTKQLPGSFSFSLAADGKIPGNQNSYVNAGGEIGWNNIFFIRGGHASLFKNNAEEGLTAGAGFSYEVGGLSLSADYAYTDFGVWSNVNRYSITIGF